MVRNKTPKTGLQSEYLAGATLRRHQPPHRSHEQRSLLLLLCLSFRQAWKVIEEEEDPSFPSMQSQRGKFLIFCCFLKFSYGIKTHLEGAQGFAEKIMTH